jgi:hypothetical protein
MINDSSAVFDEYGQVNSSEYLNFTWSPISMIDNQLTMNIGFKHKLNISQE